MKHLASIGSLSVLLVTGAQAQISNPFTVRAGYSYLPNSSAADIGKQGGYTVGLGWDFYEYKQQHIRIGLDLDYSNNNGNGNKIETGSLQVVARAPFMTGKGPQSAEFYYGVGAGVYRSLVSVNGTINTGSNIIGTSSSDMVWSGGGELLLGARLAHNYGLEIYYRLLASNSGVQVSTLGIVAAVHF